MTNAKKKGSSTPKSSESTNQDEKTRVDILSEIKKIKKEFSSGSKDDETRFKYGSSFTRPVTFQRSKEILLPLVKSPKFPMRPCNWLRNFSI